MPMSVAQLSALAFVPVAELIARVRLEAVAITIERVEVNTPGCVVVSRCEALSPADWWHEEDHVVNLAVTDGLITLGEGWAVPVSPLIGCLATTPAHDSTNSRSLELLKVSIK